MKKVTKKEVENFLREVREPNTFGWKLWRAGAYIYNNKLNYFIAYHGQGLDEIVYNEKYDEIVEFEELADKNEYTLNDAVDLAYDEINDMIENQEN